jgi:transposase
VRGTDERTGELFSYLDLEARIRPEHPLRTIRAVANEALAAIASDLRALYAGFGRPSIPPERLLRAMLLAKRSTRSARSGS